MLQSVDISQLKLNALADIMGQKVAVVMHF